MKLRPKIKMLDLNTRVFLRETLRMRKMMMMRRKFPELTTLNSLPTFLSALKLKNCLSTFKGTSLRRLI